MKAHTAVSKLLSEAARVAKDKETDTDAERKWVASAVEATRKIRALQVKCSSIQSDSELQRIREAAAIVKKLLDGPVTVLQSSPPPTKAAVDKYDAFFTNSEALKNAATAAPMVGLDCAIIAPLKTALAEYRTSLTT